MSKKYVIHAPYESRVIEVRDIAGVCRKYDSEKDADAIELNKPTIHAGYQINSDYSLIFKVFKLHDDKHCIIVAGPTHPNVTDTENLDISYCAIYDKDHDIVVPLGVKSPFHKISNELFEMMCDGWAKLYARECFYPIPD